MWSLTIKNSLCREQDEKILRRCHEVFSITISTLAYSVQVGKKLTALVCEYTPHRSTKWYSKACYQFDKISRHDGCIVFCKIILFLCRASGSAGKAGITHYKWARWLWPSPFENQQNCHISHDFESHRCHKGIVLTHRLSRLIIIPVRNKKQIYYYWLYTCVWSRQSQDTSSYPAPI